MLIREIDWREPASVFAAWADAPHTAWLESGGPIGARGRYCYIGVDPFRVLSADASGVTLDGVAWPEIDAFSALARLLDRQGSEPTPGPTPFMGGAIGFLGYDLAGETPASSKSRPFPFMHFGLFDLVFAFDRLTEKAWLYASGRPETDADRAAARARSRAAAALHTLASAPAPMSEPLPPVAWRAETTAAEHQARVARVLDYIAAGDVYQVNLSARFLADRPAGVSGAALFAAVHARNPAPFAAYLGCGPGHAIASTSPERFISVTADGVIETRPIKGTRPRGRTEPEDAALAQALARSPKDRAENLMIVDLLRNDISRVAAVGSVRAPTLWEIETFAHVHHLVSTVRGQLTPGRGAVDLLRAAFPGGSITGAPKIRAMRIITELETAPRGPYCGALAWLGFDGAMDSSILIRTLVITPDLITAQAGGGIVADSDPADEYRELRLKVRPLLRALGEEPA